MSKKIEPLSPEERKVIMKKMEAKTPLTWEECDRLLDHIEYLEGELKTWENSH